MKNVLKNGSRLSKASGHLSLFLIGSLSFLMMLSGCGTNTGNTVNAVQVSPPPASGAKGYPVTVYFPKRNPSRLETKLFPVQRLSPPTKAVATYALQLLIAGPTVEEQEAGYYSDLNDMLQGHSTCGSDEHGGPDFRLTLDRRGKYVEVGTATVQFCRQIIGIAAIPDAIVRNQIGTTLEQFPTIKKVLILMMDGRCFEAEGLEGAYCESYQP
jgi:spore germination protein GerM